MRLRLIAEADFRKSELTNYHELVNPRSLGSDDVALLVSRKRDQLVFVRHETETPVLKTALGGKIARAGHGDAKVLRSEKLRLSGGRWNPLMLANYAEQVGLELEGLEKFEEHYNRRLRERAQKAK